MGEPSGIKPFQCDTIDRASIRTEWQKWVRAFQLYLDAENIQDKLRKRNKLLHLGGIQLQEVAYNIPGATVQDNKDEQKDVFQILVDALTKYFSPTQNSTFERHTFRNLKPKEGETLNKFLLRLRQQAAKCSFGKTAEESMEINIKHKLIDNWAPLELKRKLLEKERSLLEIIDLCQIHEQITDQSKAMNIMIDNTPSTSVNRVTARSRHIQICYRCGSSRHLGNDDNCPAKAAKCRKCERWGNFAISCKTKTKKKGKTEIIPKHPNKDIITSFFVVDQGDVSIFGKDTAKRIGVLKLGLGVNRIQEASPFPKIKNITVKLTIDKSVRPVQQPLRRVPMAIEALVENKLKEALQRDIIEPVEEYSAWISPIVVTFKANGDIRICVDMRRANEAILRENYPLPTFDSILTKIRTAKYFSRLDLEWAYHQIELDEESRPITTVITHKGMFRYKRLMFGVTSAPEIFQRIFENILAHCKNSLNYLDDIIVYGSTEQEHDACLGKVITVFQENGILLNKTKCIKKVQKLRFLGHVLSHKGIETDQDKVKTIL